jgi:hypothetical protein
MGCINPILNVYPKQNQDLKVIAALPYSLSVIHNNQAMDTTEESVRDSLKEGNLVKWDNWDEPEAVLSKIRSSLKW